MFVASNREMYASIITAYQNDAVVALSDWDLKMIVSDLDCLPRRELVEAYNKIRDRADSLGRILQISIVAERLRDCIVA